MKIPLIKSYFLSILGSSLIFGSVFSQTDIEEYQTSGPLQLMFQDEHDQEKLTPSQSLNRKAVSAMGKQDWKVAFGFLMEAMKADPSSPETFINFGVAHFMREEYPSSEKALLKSLEVDPNSAKANYHYSQVMVIKGDATLAMEAANQAVVLSEEGEWKYLEWLGELKIGESSYQEAADTYTKALGVLQEKVDTVHEAIKREESRQEVAEQYTDIEIISDGTTSREVEVQKFRYEYKDAPEEWHQMEERLKGHMADIQKRKEDALNKAGA